MEALTLAVAPAPPAVTPDSFGHEQTSDREGPHHPVGVELDASISMTISHRPRWPWRAHRPVDSQLFDVYIHLAVDRAEDHALAANVTNSPLGRVSPIRTRHPPSASRRSLSDLALHEHVDCPC